MIWAVKIPLKRKIAISILLSSGVFVITAAILRCILSLKYIDEVGASTIWGIRETFISVLAISAAAIKPYFSRSRWVGTSQGTAPGHSTPGKVARSDLKRGSVKIPSTSQRTFGNAWEDNSDIELGLTKEPTRRESEEDFDFVTTPDMFTKETIAGATNSKQQTSKADTKSTSSRAMQIQVTTTFINEDDEDRHDGQRTPNMWSPHRGKNITMISSSGAQGATKLAKDR